MTRIVVRTSTVWHIFLNWVTAGHWDSWIKSLEVSNNHRWQWFMAYLHFPTIAFLIRLCWALQWLKYSFTCTSKHCLTEDSCYVKCFFTYLSHFPADNKLILFSDQSVSHNLKLRHITKILHFYSNQPLFNCVVFISKSLSFKISHMWQVTL